MIHSGGSGVCMESRIAPGDLWHHYHKCHSDISSWKMQPRQRCEGGNRAFGTSLPQTLCLKGPQQVVTAPSLCWLASSAPLPAMLSPSCISPAEVVGPWGSRSPPHTWTSAHLLQAHSCHSLRWSFQHTREEKGQPDGPAAGAEGGACPRCWLQSQNPWNNGALRVGPSKREETDFVSLPAGASGSLIMLKCHVNREDLLTWLAGLMWKHKPAKRAVKLWRKIILEKDN